MCGRLEMLHRRLDGAGVSSWIGSSDFHLSCFGGDSVSGHGTKRVRETCSDVTRMI